MIVMATALLSIVLLSAILTELPSREGCAVTASKTGDVGSTAPEGAPTRAPPGTAVIGYRVTLKPAPFGLWSLWV